MFSMLKCFLQIHKLVIFQCVRFYQHSQAIRPPCNSSVHCSRLFLREGLFCCCIFYVNFWSWTQWHTCWFHKHRIMQDCDLHAHNRNLVCKVVKHAKYCLHFIIRLIFISYLSYKVRFSLTDGDHFQDNILQLFRSCGGHCFLGTPLSLVPSTRKELPSPWVPTRMPFLLPYGQNALASVVPLLL